MASNDTFSAIGRIGAGGSYEKSLFTFNEADTDFLSTNDFVALDLDGVVDSFKAATAITGHTTFAGDGGSGQCEDLVLENRGEKTLSEEANVSDHPAKVKKKRKKRTQGNVETKSFPCDLCDETFNLSSELKCHKISMHPLAKLYRCEECSMAFNFPKNLFLHIATHSTAPATCPDCGKIFQRISSFVGHLESHIENDNFKCQACDMEFEFEQYYERHLEKEHRDEEIMTSVLIRKRRSREDGGGSNGKYACKTCGKRFPKPSLLLRHEIAHAKVKPFVCVDCNKTFSQKCSLDRHRMLHSGIKPHNCPKCSMSFSQRTNLITHIKRAHTTKNAEVQFPCDSCSCVFSKLKSLNRHKTLRHSSKTDTNKELSFTEILEHIMSLHEDNKARPNPTSSNQNTVLTDDHIVPKKLAKVNNVPACPPEKEQYVTVADCLYPTNERHDRTVKEINDNGVKRLECLYCPKRFQSPYDMVRHTRTHTLEKPFECEYCGRKFSLKNTMKLHMKIHRKKPNEVTNLYHCTYCQKSFDSLRNLDLHVRIHSTYKPHICPICFKTFKSTNSLSKHKLNHELKNPEDESIKRQLLPPIIQNTDDKPKEDPSVRTHQCSKCGIRFKKISHLKQHEHSHLKLKNFQCKICQKFFSTKSSLGFHQKIHLGHKTAACEVCHKQFCRNSDLKRHRTVHSNFRNFVCPYCKKAFKRKCNCQKHIKLHVKDVLITEEVENVPLVSDTDGNIPEIDETATAAPNNQSDEVNQIVFSTMVQAPPDLNQAIQSEVNLPIISDLNQANPPEILQTFVQDTANEVIQPCNMVLLLQTTQTPVNINSPLEQRDNVILVDIGKFWNEDTFLSTDCVNTQLENQSVIEIRAPTPPHSVPTQPEFISISDLNNYSNKLAKNIVVVSHEKNPDSCDSLPEAYLSDSEPHGEEFLIQEAGVKIAEKAREKAPKMKPPHACSICKKVFQKPSDLVRHIRTHTKEKPFRCDTCSKAFSLKSTLDNHKLIHEKDRPTFECHVCGKKYAAKNVLNIHLRLHTGERPFQCEICSKTFRTSGHKAAHNRVHVKAKMEAARKRRRT